MAKLTPSEAREKHARRLKGALDDMRKGVESVTVAPGKKAAAAQAKMRASIVESIDSGKWARKVGAVSLEDWKKAMTEKGLNRVASGIDGAAEKVEAFFAELFPYQDSLQRELENMPDLTLEDSIQRMTKWVRGMAKFTPK